ncbi:MAG: ankyrin repeat domain-containing protein [Candidatus Babeliales bacterium]
MNKIIFSGLIITSISTNIVYSMDQENFLNQYQKNNENLINAAKANNIEQVKKILNILIEKLHSQTACLTEVFFSAMHTAAEKNDAEAIHLLLKSDTPDRIKKISTIVVFVEDCINDYVPIIETIVEHYPQYIKYPCDQECFLYAIQNNFIKMVKIILKHPQANPFLDTMDKEDYYTPLEIAQKNNHTKMIKILKKAEKKYIKKLEHKKEKRKITLKKLNTEIKDLKNFSNVKK